MYNITIDYSAKLFHLSATSLSALYDDPPSAKATAVASFNSFTLFLKTFPSSPSINSFTTLAISSLSIKPSSPFFGRIAIFTPSTNIIAFIACSANNGQAIIGTPCVTLSSVEFHPQCDRNPPVDECASTSICGAHDGTTKPTPCVRSIKPSGTSQYKEESLLAGFKSQGKLLKLLLRKGPRASKRNE
ncbi:hypothetical protein M5K25_024453 [Dendrobium thyrsiflorum]|uniref:Uncharacterized protein n=1 Tax=Dendrobium thyrsiflorum TaxID=117978 RepID=A0ABD0U2C6_DENTH